MKFQYYVLNSDLNSGNIKPFNIFSNYHVQESVEKRIRRYLKSPKSYKTLAHDGYSTLVGFPALCEDIRKDIMWQEWSRCEYEILVGNLHNRDVDSFTKVDCYAQALPNIDVITRECIYQYKAQMKESV